MPNEEIDRIIIDTGNSDKSYRVNGDLKRKVCPRCNINFFSSWDHNFCPECFVIDIEERKIGRILTKDEITKVLEDTGFKD